MTEASNNSSQFRTPLSHLSNPSLPPNSALPSPLLLPSSDLLPTQLPRSTHLFEACKELLDSEHFQQYLTELQSSE
jgi:hypothetical protein